MSSANGDKGSGGSLLVNRVLLPAAILLFLVLLLTAGLLVQFAVNERDQQGWVVHTYQVIDRLESVLADAQDEETGQRGYIITGDPSYLAPYRAGIAHMERDLGAYRALTVDNPRQQARAGTLEALVADRFSALQKSMAAVPRNENPREAKAFQAAMAAGKARMDQLRAVIRAAIADEKQLLAGRIAARRNAEAREITTAIVAALLALAILLAAAIILIRNNIALSRSESVRTRQAAILQATLDTIREGVVVFDREGKLRAFNQAFFGQLDFPDTLAVLGADIAEFRAVDARRPQQVFSQRPDAPSRPDQTYQRVTLNDRELDVYHASVAGGSFLVASMDVTARVHAEATVRQSQKMEAVGQLTGGAAHDFNNLLQIISANLDLIAADARGNARASERLHNVMAAVERGSRLTGQLLAFSRKQALEPRTINLGRLVQNMTDLLRRTLGEQTEVEAVIAGGLWNSLVDPMQVENAVLNLAINARDAMPEGGKLTIELANAFLDDAYASGYEDVTPGQYVMLAVTDTGTGMSPDVAQRAFDPFFTTKPEGRGTGLGLSQVYGFVKQSGGHIKIYSEVGQGTTVKLYLPRTRKAEEAAEPVMSARPAEGGQETVLVVEDDAGVRSAVVDMLGELGYSTLRARNAEEALVLLDSGAPIDLLFTDVVMPGPISTRELARRAQTLHPDIAVLYTSGYTQNAIVHNGKLDDGVLLISKPYRKDDLARKLRTALSGSRKPALPEPAIGPAATRAPASGARRSKALVVEDIALIRMSTVDMVEQLGFEALEAGDGMQALAILKGDEEIDLLLTDVGLPGLNGHQLTTEALRIRPGLKVVVTTGYSDKASGSAHAAGVVFLMKPFDLAQLRRALGA